jgi:hypothetical protein
MTPNGQEFNLVLSIFPEAVETLRVVCGFRIPEIEDGIRQRRPFDKIG